VLLLVFVTLPRPFACFSLALSPALFLSSSDGYVDLYVGATVPYFLKDGCIVNENNLMINGDLMGANSKVPEVKSKNYI
jgi:hypothetical protein